MVLENRYLHFVRCGYCNLRSPWNGHQCEYGQDIEWRFNRPLVCRCTEAAARKQRGCNLLGYVRGALQVYMSFRSHVSSSLGNGKGGVTNLQRILKGCYGGGVGFKNHVLLRACRSGVTYVIYSFGFGLACPL
jgi:hypothetical protein